MPKKITKAQQKKSFKGEFLSQMVSLSTAGFGLVAALAWNDTIEQVVKDFIEPRIPGSGILSRLIYALLITALAVLITYQLSLISARWQQRKD